MLIDFTEMFTDQEASLISLDNFSVRGNNAFSAKDKVRIERVLSIRLTLLQVWSKLRAAFGRTALGGSSGLAGNLRAVALDRIACTFLQISRLHQGFTKKDLTTIIVVIAIDTGASFPIDVRIPDKHDPRSAILQYREPATLEGILTKYMVTEGSTTGADSVDQAMEGLHINFRIQHFAPKYPTALSARTAT